MEYKAYDCIFTSCEDFQNFAEQEALEYARGMVWSEVETSVQSIAHARHVATVNGVGVYYAYGADYFFFTDEEEEEVKPTQGLTDNQKNRIQQLRQYMDEVGEVERVDFDKWFEGRKGVCVNVKAYLLLILEDS